MTDPIELTVLGPAFFSEMDEATFFQWLEKIPCVNGFEGVGYRLALHISRSALSEEALRELLALFHRYELDMSALRIFDTPEFSRWFLDKRAYWHHSVFGSESP